MTLEGREEIEPRVALPDGESAPAQLLELMNLACVTNYIPINLGRPERAVSSRSEASSARVPVPEASMNKDQLAS